MDLGAESAVVETTDVQEKIMEEEPTVAAKEFTSETPAAPLDSAGKHRTKFRCTQAMLKTKKDFIICMMVSPNYWGWLWLTAITMHSLISNVECSTAEQGPSCPPADQEGPEEAARQVTQTSPSQDQTEGTRCNSPEVQLPGSQQGPENMEVEKEEKKGTTSLSEQEVLAELSNSNSDGVPVTEPLCQDLPKLPASSASLDKTEHMSMADERKSPCLDQRSPSPLSLSVDTQEALSAVDMEGRLLPHSEEEEEEEEDDEQMKGDEHTMAIKQELHEQKIKPELLLDELSNMSHGDESSSGFMGSPGEPDQQLSMELGLEPSGRSHTDNLLTETDDSLPFEPLRSDREKVKRRGSPGRSRVKQVSLPSTWMDHDVC